jgi:hypothetical protein
VNPTNSAIIVRNGTLTEFETGINVSPASSGFIINVKIQNVTFLGELITSVVLGNPTGAPSMIATSLVSQVTVCQSTGLEIWEARRVTHILATFLMAHRKPHYQLGNSHFQAV